jgi:hypothetical protein
LQLTKVASFFCLMSWCVSICWHDCIWLSLPALKCKLPAPFHSTINRCFYCVFGHWFANLPWLPLPFAVACSMS